MAANAARCPSASGPAGRRHHRAAAPARARRDVRTGRRAARSAAPLRRALELLDEQTPSVPARYSHATTRPTSSCIGTRVVAGHRVALSEDAAPLAVVLDDAGRRGRRDRRSTARSARQSHRPWGPGRALPTPRLRRRRARQPIPRDVVGVMTATAAGGPRSRRRTVPSTFGVDDTDAVAAHAADLVAAVQREVKSRIS